MVSDSNLGVTLSDKEIKMAYMICGATLKDIRGISSAEMDAMYRVAFGHFSAERYNESLVMFRYLSLLDHYNYSYLLGLGATLASLETFKKAIDVLDSAIFINKDDPRAFICKAKCLIYLNDFEDAGTLLKNAEINAKGSDSWVAESQQIKRLQLILDNN